MLDFNWRKKFPLLFSFVSLQPVGVADFLFLLFTHKDTKKEADYLVKKASSVSLETSDIKNNTNTMFIIDKIVITIVSFNSL